MSTGWMIAIAMHVVAIVVLITMPFAHKTESNVITFIPLERPMPAYAGQERRSAPQGGYGAVRPEPPAPIQAPPPKLATPAPLAAVAETTSGPPREARGLPIPQLGSGVLWVAPRPALPGDVADVMYNDTLARDRPVVQRLKAMVDSLNEMLDEQRAQSRKPSWTTEVAGKEFGIDSQYIHVAGIAIPTAALALLPIRLPEGNYDEYRRSRQLELMRQDLLYSAMRTQTLADFRRYVHELRDRKQAEHDFEERQKGTKKDTVVTQ
ncbi:MAG TPA: hypothetical protein VFD85_13490 [Gemmatimonadales bacterium]|nr:hypothetical protein [Gemmatimonadales bacterium]